MISLVNAIAFILYCASVSLLAAYGVHSLWLLGLFLRHRRAAARTESEERSWPLPDALPAVLVQLPVYNERDVVERLVEAAGRLEWPADRLRIQLLDDSTDDGVTIGRRAVEALRARGIDATWLHRVDRTGYKAGALAAGLEADARRAEGAAEFVAIFDADFVPRPDFLRRAVVPLLRDAGLALVQGRWEHLNRDANVFTRAQALGIDGHFAVEQGARAWSGLPMNFNGTCGLWRRAAIEQAGGWEHDTLTEDMDLSYRVQLAGWRCTYRLGISVPGEIPATIAAWRAQQFRWAKGSVQTAVKLLGRVLRSRWSVRAKIASAFHLTHYFVHPLILLSLVCAPLAMPCLTALPPHLLVLGAVTFAVGAGSPIALYVAAQLSLRGRGGWRRLRGLPALASLGTGIAVSDTRAVWQALRGRQSAFVRTPKQGDRPRASYRAAGSSGLPELACAVWAGAGLTLGFYGANRWIAPILALYLSGFAWVGLRLAWEARVPPRGDAGTRWVRSLVPAGVLSVVGYAVLATRPGTWRDEPVTFAIVGLALGLLYVVSLESVRRTSPARGALAWIIVIALAMRAAAFGLAPSDDLNRYIVEGTQVRRGENPYLIAPRDSAVVGDLPAGIRDGVNHADWTAIYPPVTLAFEAAVTAIRPSASAFKAALAAAELLGLAAVLALIRRRGLPPALLLAAAWNPVGPLFGAGEGHVDALTAAILAGSLLLGQSGRPVGAIAGTALAALTKPFAAVALPPQIVARGARGWLLPALVAGLAYLPFAAAGPALFRSLGRFGEEMHFHGALEPPVRAFMQLVAPAEWTRAATIGVLGLSFCLICAGVWRRSRVEGATAEGVTARLLAALLLCLPTIHPWYLAPLVMLLPFTRSRGLAIWTAMAPIYWLHGVAMQRGGGWTETPWVTAAAHVPALLVLFAEVSGPASRRPAAGDVAAAELQRA